MRGFIGIDAGRDGVKADNGLRQLSFKSKVGEARERRLVEKLKYEVEIDGRRYFVADLADESRYKREMATDNKIHEETRILFLTAAALIMDTDEVSITTGLPVDQHTPEIKAQMIELLRGRHEVKVEGRTIKLTIGEIGICAEGTGIYWNEVMDQNGQIKNTWIYGRLTRVLDLGSRKFNYCTIKPGGKYYDLESGSLQYGMIDLDNAEDCETDEGKAAFARKIAADMSKKWLSYNPTKEIVLIGGGGTLRIGQQIMKHFPLSTIAGNPLFANAAGFGKMGKARWQQKGN